MQTRLARLLRHTAGNDDDARLVEVRILPRAHRQRVREWNRVMNIVGLGLGARTIHVHQYNLPSHAAHDQREGRGRADHAAADDANFHA